MAEGGCPRRKGGLAGRWCFQRNLQTNAGVAQLDDVSLIEAGALNPLAVDVCSFVLWLSTT
jgi:hypothetical protein